MSNNPYKILGLNPGASEAEIKKAYRELVKKYHPDKYQGNPLADLAEEKLREVNEAYDTLINSMTAGAGTSGYGTGGSGYGSYGNFGSSYEDGDKRYSSYSSYGTGTSGSYYEVRAALDRNDLFTAEQLLINSHSRDAEWFFLSGVLSFKKGFVSDGMANLNQAMQMDPGNKEYAQVYEQISDVKDFYRRRSDAYGYNRNVTAGDLLCCSTLPLCFCC